MDNASDQRLENVLGSVAVAITGAVQAAVDEAAGHTAAGPAALTALRIHRGCSVDHLAGVLGLTHSGTVRLVDRLEDDGLLRRGQGQDARVVTLELTAKGTRRAERVSAARATAVEGFLGEPRPLGAVDADAAAREGGHDRRRGLERGAAPLPRSAISRRATRGGESCPLDAAHGRARRRLVARPFELCEHVLPGVGV